MNKKGIASFELVLLLVSVFAFTFMVAEPVVADTAMSEPSVCCERTDDGAWCVNAPEGDCDSGYNTAPTSCESTSYCRSGTCYESEEGICMESTPSRVCNAEGGTWDAREIELVPQCRLGCCIIADQAAFVSLVRCKRLSSLFGVENNYRTDIGSEVGCIAAAQAQDVGACVYEKEFERVCEFTTRGDCGAELRVEAVNGTNISLSSERTFYEDYLCSAEELSTACGKQAGTTCYRGDVYWTDSCGNRENVYYAGSDAKKLKSWNAGKVAEGDEVCGPSDGSDINCGNCDYFLGSRCAEYEGFLGGPSEGDNYCRVTECKDREGNDRINGESWCVYDGASGNGADAVGSRYFRELCVDGEVRVEPCADFRNEICLSDSVEIDPVGYQGSNGAGAGSFGTAACRVNRWQDCVAIGNWEDCINIDRRDCRWVGGATGMNVGGAGASASGGSGSGTFSNPTGSVVAPITGHGIFGGGDDEEEEETVSNRPNGVCVPNFPPGFEFWKAGNAGNICSQANARCVVVKEEDLLGDEDIAEGEECLEEEWALAANEVCVGLGDCGGYVNYQGAYDGGYSWVEDGDKRVFSANSVNKIVAYAGLSGVGILGLTGMVVGVMTGRVVGITGKPVSQASGYPYSGDVDVAMAEATAAEAEAAAAIDAELAAADAAWAAEESVLAGIDAELVAIEAEANAMVAAAEAAEAAQAATALAKDSSYLSDAFLTPKQLASTEFWGGLGANSIISGLQWAGAAYGAGMMIGSMIGLSKDNTEALSTSLALGFGTYRALHIYQLGTQAGGQAVPWLISNPAIAGLVIGVIVFAWMYKSVDTEVVEFKCYPWQAPVGGNACEVCNDDELPCSEYRCRALGQNCEIVNAGTEEERCVNVNPRDVVPPMIRPNYADLTRGHDYRNVKNSPPGPGFDIVNSEADGGCLKAFTPLEFGISVDEPAQCRIDFNHTEKFDDMVTFVGGSNLYSYNHTEKFSLPGAAAFANSSLVLENGKDLTFYIRCKDKAGNENTAEYAVRFCIDPTPDNTAPRVEATSVLNDGCVAEDQDTAKVNFYTNEPAGCRWSSQDEDFDNMQKGMDCDGKIYQANAMQLYTCKSELTGIERTGDVFYVRCKDQPGVEENKRNEMAESFEFRVRGSTALKMKNLLPNGTVFGAVSPMPVELRVETLFGCNDGRAICSYSDDGSAGSFITFFDTNTEDGVHTQRLDLEDGSHDYYVQCVDAGGNLVEDVVSFDLDVDINAPVVARIYEEKNMLKLVTVRDSECSYTFDNCDFSFDEGTVMPYANSSVHVAEWNEEKTYYIKCRDEFRNEDADCSVVVKPSRNFL